jgi:hypothetical protein
MTTNTQMLLRARQERTEAMASERRLPDEEGWWARHRGGRVNWFYVNAFSDAPLGVWSSDTETHVPVSEFSSPLTLWWGPVVLPWAKG